MCINMHYELHTCTWYTTYMYNVHITYNIHYIHVQKGILFTCIWAWKTEVRDALAVQAPLPAHGNVLLLLRLLEFLVVVSLQLHQRAKDVLVLVGILVAASGTSDREQPETTTYMYSASTCTVLVHTVCITYECAPMLSRACTPALLPNWLLHTLYMYSNGHCDLL